MSATSVDTTLGLIAFYTGRGGPVDLRSLPYAVLTRSTLELALVVRRCLGTTAEEREAELARLSLYLQLSDLEHPAGVAAALSLLASVTPNAEGRQEEPVRLLLALPPDVLEPTIRRLAWLAHGLLGDDDEARTEALAGLSLQLQLAQLDGDGAG